MSNRLAEIKDLLSKTTSRDKTTLPLYREALSLFQKAGQRQAALKCQETIARLERKALASENTEDAENTENELKSEIESENRKDGRKKQSSILTWATSGSSNDNHHQKSLSETLKAGRSSAIPPRAIKQESKWPEMPIELLLMVSKYLSNFDIYRLSLSCARFKTVLQSAPSFWTQFDWGINLSKRLRNQHLQFLYQMTRGECTSFQLKNAAHISPATFLALAKSKYPAMRLVELIIQENSKLTASCLVPFLSQKSLRSSMTKLSLVSMPALDDKGVALLFNMLENVKDWNFSGCSGLSDASISSLPPKKILKVESMIIRHCSFTDKFVHHLVSMSAPTLQTVDFFDCKSVTKQALITLSKCSKLDRLEFTGINSKWPSNLDLDDAIMMLTQANPDIRGFQWRNCPFIRDTSLTSIAEFCSGLDVLVLDGSANISDAGFLSLALAAPKLQLLSLKSCPRLSSVVFSTMIKSSGDSWVKVDVSGNYWVIDEHMSLLATHCPNLLSLTLANVPRVTSMGLHAFAEHHSNGNMKRKRLQELILPNNPHFSNDSLNRLKSVFTPKVVLLFAE